MPQLSNILMGNAVETATQPMKTTSQADESMAFSSVLSQLEAQGTTEVESASPTTASILESDLAADTGEPEQQQLQTADDDVGLIFAQINLANTIKQSQEPAADGQSLPPVGDPGAEHGQQDAANVVAGQDFSAETLTPLGRGERGTRLNELQFGAQTATTDAQTDADATYVGDADVAMVRQLASETLASSAESQNSVSTQGVHGTGAESLSPGAEDGEATPATPAAVIAGINGKTEGSNDMQVEAGPDAAAMTQPGAGSMSAIDKGAQTVDAAITSGAPSTQDGLAPAYAGATTQVSPQESDDAEAVALQQLQSVAQPLAAQNPTMTAQSVQVAAIQDTDAQVRTRARAEALLANASLTIGADGKPGSGTGTPSLQQGGAAFQARTESQAGAQDQIADALSGKVLSTREQSASGAEMTAKVEQQIMANVATKPAMNEALFGSGDAGVEIKSAQSQGTINIQAATGRNEVPQFQLSVRQAGEPQNQLQEMIQRFSPVMKQQLVTMVSKGIQQAEIRLDPPELGHMMVRVQVQGEQTQVQFQAAHAQTRDILEQAMPRLREMLSEQGMQLTDGQVSQGNAGKEQGRGGSEADAREHGGQEMDEISAEELRLSANQTTSYTSAIDYYA